MSSNGHNLLDIKVYITLRPHEEIVKLVIMAVKVPSLVIPIWESDEARLLVTMLLRGRSFLISFFGRGPIWGRLAIYLIQLASDSWFNLAMLVVTDAETPRSY